MTTLSRLLFIAAPLISVLLACLKYFDAISWSWWVIASPALFAAAAFCVVFASMFVPSGPEESDKQCK